jgi:hypothetical protein
MNQTYEIMEYEDDSNREKKENGVQNREIEFDVDDILNQTGYDQLIGGGYFDHEKGFLYDFGNLLI